MKNCHLLPEAVSTAARLAHQVAQLGLFLAGTPEEILVDLVKLAAAYAPLPGGPVPGGS